MKNTYVKLLNKIFNIEINYYFDLILFSIVICYLAYNLLCILLSLVYISLDPNYKEIIFTMVENNNLPSTSTHSTNVTIIHDDGGWSNAIRQMFIYGTGALRIHLIRHGTPGSKGFVIATSLLADGLSKAVNNTLNDPDYVLRHAQNWKKIWADADTVKVVLDEETTQILKQELQIQEPPVDFHSFSNFNDITDKLFDMLMANLKTVLEPVSVTYSNELLLQQLHGLSILLFVLSLLIIAIFLVFIINTFVLIYSDRILNFFKNKYIRAYIIFNKKMIGLEILILSISLLYFLFTLSKGLHFICTHPVNIT